jgi:hypothetical protein
MRKSDVNCPQEQKKRYCRKHGSRPCMHNSQWFSTTLSSNQRTLQRLRTRAKQGKRKKNSLRPPVISTLRCCDPSPQSHFHEQQSLNADVDRMYSRHPFVVCDFVITVNARTSKSKSKKNAELLTPPIRGLRLRNHNKRRRDLQEHRHPHARRVRKQGLQLGLGRRKAASRVLAECRL